MDLGSGTLANLARLRDYTQPPPVVVGPQRRQPRLRC